MAPPSVKTSGQFEQNYCHARQCCLPFKFRRLFPDKEASALFFSVIFTPFLPCVKSQLTESICPPARCTHINLPHNVNFKLIVTVCENLLTVCFHFALQWYARLVRKKHGISDNSSGSPVCKSSHSQLTASHNCPENWYSRGT